MGFFISLFANRLALVALLVVGGRFLEVQSSTVAAGGFLEDVAAETKSQDWVWVRHDTNNVSSLKNLLRQKGREEAGNCAVSAFATMLFRPDDQSCCELPCDNDSHSEDEEEEDEFSGDKLPDQPEFSGDKLPDQLSLRRRPLRPRRSIGVIVNGAAQKNGAVGYPGDLWSRTSFSGPGVQPDDVMSGKQASAVMETLWPFSQTATAEAECVFKPHVDTVIRSGLLKTVGPREPLQLTEEVGPVVLRNNNPANFRKLSDEVYSMRKKVTTPPSFLEIWFPCVSSFYAVTVNSRTVERAELESLEKLRRNRELRSHHPDLKLVFFRGGDKISEIESAEHFFLADDISVHDALVGTAVWKTLMSDLDDVGERGRLVEVLDLDGLKVGGVSEIAFSKVLQVLADFANSTPDVTAPTLLAAIREEDQKEPQRYHREEEKNREAQVTSDAEASELYKAWGMPGDDSTPEQQNIWLLERIRKLSKFQVLSPLYTETDEEKIDALKLLQGEHFFPLASYMKQNWMCVAYTYFTRILVMDFIQSWNTNKQAEEGVDLEQVREDLETNEDWEQLRKWLRVTGAIHRALEIHRELGLEFGLPHPLRADLADLNDSEEPVQRTFAGAGSEEADGKRGLLYRAMWMNGRDGDQVISLDSKVTSWGYHFSAVWSVLFTKHEEWRGKDCAFRRLRDADGYAEGEKEKLDAVRAVILLFPWRAFGGGTKTTGAASPSPDETPIATVVDRLTGYMKGGGSAPAIEQETTTPLGSRFGFVRLFLPDTRQPAQEHRLPILTWKDVELAFRGEGGICHDLAWPRPGGQTQTTFVSEEVRTAQKKFRQALQRDVVWELNRKCPSRVRVALEAVVSSLAEDICSQRADWDKYNRGVLDDYGMNLISNALVQIVGYHCE